MTIEEIQLQNLHYFFSTAPQVLGALLAITGAFVVFKLDSLKKEFLSTSQRLIDIGKSKTANDLPYEFDYSLFKFFKEYYNEDYETLTYCQLGNNISLIRDIVLLVNNKMNKDRNDKAKREKVKEEGFKKLSGISSIILMRYDQIERFVKSTKRVIIINGLIIAILFLIFILLPIKISCYGILLSFGMIISLISLFLIIRFLLKSVNFYYNEGDFIITNGISEEGKEQ